MSVFLAAMKSIVETLTLQAANAPLMALTLALSLVAAWITFGKMITALKFPMDSGWRPLVSFISFVIIAFLAAALVKAFIAPRVSHPGLSRFIPLIAASIIFLGAIIPLSCFLMKSKYGQTIAAFLAPIVAAAIVAFLLKGIAGAVKQGEKGFSKTKNRTETFNEEINK